jgi:hypothetical protein
LSAVLLCWRQLSPVGTSWHRLTPASRVLRPPACFLLLLIIILTFTHTELCLFALVLPCAFSSLSRALLAPGDPLPPPPPIIQHLSPSNAHKLLLHRPRRNHPSRPLIFCRTPVRTARLSCPLAPAVLPAGPTVSLRAASRLPVVATQRLLLGSQILPAPLSPTSRYTYMQPGQPESSGFWLSSSSLRCVAVEESS